MPADRVQPLLHLVRRAAASRWVRWAFVVAAVALAVWAVWDQWPQVSDSLDRLGAGPLAASAVCGMLGLLASLLAWRALLADLGSRLPVRAAARVFFVSQLGKYEPGSVWPVLAQMEMGREFAVPRRRSATVFVLTVLVSLASGLLVADILLPLTAGDAVATYAWALVLAPFIIAALHPRILNPVINRLLRLLRRAPLERPLSLRGTLTAFGWTCAGWLAYGTHLWLLVRPLGLHGAHAYPLAIGAFALAWCVGFIVVIAPAGAGVRDAGMVATVGASLGTGAALTAAIASRLLLTLCDLAAAGAGWLSLRGSPAASGLPDVAGEADGAGREDGVRPHP
jgi:uncharacterized membrane protein YbhN (UPF0104 family)